MPDHAFARRWTSRAVLAAAALAAVATSRPRWHVTPELPAGAALSTEIGGSDGVTRGVVIDLEASADPELRCDHPGGERDAVQLAPVRGGFDPGQSGVLHAQYLCPPGGALETFELAGNAASSGLGCSSPRPPDDAFLRVTRAAAVPVWTRTIDKAFTLRGSSSMPNSTIMRITLRGPGQGVLTVGRDATPTLQLVPAGANQWQMSEALADDETLLHSVTVHASIYGPCPAVGACAAPDASAFTLEAL